MRLSTIRYTFLNNKIEMVRSSIEGLATSFGALHRKLDIINEKIDNPPVLFSDISVNPGFTVKSPDGATVNCMYRDEDGQPVQIEDITRIEPQGCDVWVWTRKGELFIINSVHHRDIQFIPQHPLKAKS